MSQVTPPCRRWTSSLQNFYSKLFLISFDFPIIILIFNISSAGTFTPSFSLSSLPSYIYLHFLCEKPLLQVLPYRSQLLARRMTKRSRRWFAWESISLSWCKTCGNSFTKLGRVSLACLNHLSEKSSFCGKFPGDLIACPRIFSARVDFYPNLADMSLKARFQL